MKIKSLTSCFCLFLLLYTSLIVFGVVTYTYFNFGVVSLNKFLPILDEVFYLDWAVKKIKIYSLILLFASFLIQYFVKTKYIIVMSVFMLLSPVAEFDIISQFKYQNSKTDFYEKNYIYPNIENKQKNNLIILYLESIEKHYIGENGSPFLKEALSGNISFNGYKQVSETFSTIHAQFASLCGLSLSQKNLLSGDGYINFLPKVKCIPDLLKKNNYTTAYFKGADLNFSRANYFTEQHSFDIAKGLNEFKNDAKKITPNYLGNEFGGLKDRVLFELAKNEISKLPEPFFVSLTTLDTHISPNPYYDPECERKFNDFRDAVYCTGEIVGNFINWLKKQPYWDRTTIVIMGDHQAASRFLSKSEVYNVFINSKQTTNLNNRKFTTYDFAPTILEATGYDIAKFGIGRSLFREEKTLFEKEKNKFTLLISAKNDLYDKLKEFNNTKSSYKDYKINTTLNNEELFNYSDFGQQNKWCNKISYFSMKLDKKPEKHLYLKMKYLAANEPFKIFANNTKIYENKADKFKAIQEKTITINIPLEALNNDNKISIKTDWPYNNVNNVFGLCIRELSLTDQE